MSTNPTSQEKHTPTPWAVSSSTIIIATEDPRDLTIICNTLDLAGISEIGIHEARANAEFICKAVNSHASDQRRIKELETAISGALTEIDNVWGNSMAAPAARKMTMDAAIASLRSALLSQGAPK